MDFFECHCHFTATEDDLSGTSLALVHLRCANTTPREKQVQCAWKLVLFAAPFLIVFWFAAEKLRASSLLTTTSERSFLIWDVCLSEMSPVRIRTARTVEQLVMLL